MRGKKYDNQADKTKLIRALSNSDVICGNFEKKVEKSKISLGLNSNSYVLNDFHCSNDAAFSNKNKKFPSTGITMESENINLYQVNVSGRRYDINGSSIWEKDSDDLISEMWLDRSQLSTRKKTHTKGIWDSIQENIKNIISSSE